MQRSKSHRDLGRESLVGGLHASSTIRTVSCGSSLSLRVAAPPR